MKERRGKNRFVQALIADPYRKLASVALAIGLWYFIDTQIQGAYPVSALLRAVNQSARSPAETTPGNTLEVLLPLSQVAVLRFVDPTTQKPINEVNLIFSGEKFLIDNLKGGRQLIVSAGPFPGRVWENAEVFEFNAQSIVRADRVLHALTITMEPPTVQVMLERKDHRQFTLSQDNVDLQFRNPEHNDLRSRLRWETLKFVPEQVTVMGPKSRVDRFPATAETKPFLALVEPDNTQVSGKVGLNLPGNDLDMDLDAGTTVTIALAPKQEEFDVEVPIDVDDLSLSANLQGRYKPEPECMKVRIKASGKVHAMLSPLEEGPERNKWARENLRLHVWIQPREKEQDFGADVTVEAKLELTGPLRDQVDRIHYGLVQGVAVTLKSSK